MVLFYKFLGFYGELRVRNYWVSGFLGHPKTLSETQLFDKDFRWETL